MSVFLFGLCALCGYCEAYDDCSKFIIVVGKASEMDKKDLTMPRYRFRCVLDITPEDLHKMGAKAVGLDIDNTLAPDGTFNFVEGVHEWIDKIQKAGFPITVISNGTFIRVIPISKYLGNLPYVHLSCKPFSCGLKKAAKRMGVDISELAMIGDQLFSDIKAANRCGAIPVRVDPLPAKSLYPHYYKWKEKREEPILREFEKNHGYGVEGND